MAAMPEFQEGQRVRVREEGGASPTRPDKRLGQVGTIQSTAQRDVGSGRPISYWVEFDSEVVEAIGTDWLWPRGDGGHESNRSR